MPLSVASLVRAALAIMEQIIRPKATNNSTISKSDSELKTLPLSTLVNFGTDLPIYRMIPARFGFYVWFPIWILQFCFTIYQWMPMHRVRNGFLQRLNIVWTISCITNGTILNVYPFGHVPATFALNTICSATCIYMFVQLTFRKRPTLACQAAQSNVVATGWGVS